MKKVMLLVACALVAVAMTGCMSLRTTSKGANANKVYYHTFFGLSFESLIYGDGFVVDVAN